MTWLNKSYSQILKKNYCLGKGILKLNDKELIFLFHKDLIKLIKRNKDEGRKEIKKEGRKERKFETQGGKWTENTIIIYKEEM